MTCVSWRCCDRTGRPQPLPDPSLEPNVQASSVQLPGRFATWQTTPLCRSESQFVRALPSSTSDRENQPAVPTRRTTKPVILAGGNPQIAKADGDKPVQAYIAAMPGWKRQVGRRLDELISRVVPGVHKGVRWNSPMYGIEGEGWFVSFHVFTHYVKVTFFRGTSLQPVPPGGTAKEARWIDVHEHDLDDAQMAAWIAQASAIPGWGKS